LRLYGFPNTRSARALWALEEAGGEYSYVHVDLYKGEARRAPFLEINPGGKLPALVDGDTVLTESAAICIYIADKNPASQLAPAHTSLERAKFHQWCFFALSELEQPLWTLSKHRLVLPENLRVPAIMDTARWEFARAARVLSTGLGDRQYIVGDSFTVADILLANTLNWARTLRVPIEEATLNSYADRLLARPAWQRTLAKEKAAAL
jgi:glutathione S-transferase